MAVVLASPPNCIFCGKRAEAFSERHLCAQCGKPQPLRAEEDFFSALGVARRFAQDPAELQKNFYAVSRLLHPDRFTGASGAGAEDLKNSLDRMSFLNEAYRVLRVRDNLRETILKLEGLDANGKNRSPDALPAEFTEEWFELQDRLMEEEERALPKLEAFCLKLEEKRGSLETGLRELEVQYDASEEVVKRAEILRQILQLVHAQAYLRSLLSSVQKNLQRFGLSKG